MTNQCQKQPLFINNENVKFKLMKKLTLLSFQVVFFLVHFTFIAQAQSSSGCTHLIITDESLQSGLGSCDSPFMDGDVLELIIRKAIDLDIPSMPTCPQMRILAREVTTQSVIGVSDPITNWTSDNSESRCPCEADVFLKSKVNIELDFSIACEEHPINGEPTIEEGEIQVVYEIVEATPNEFGQYPLYHLNNQGCYDYFFSEGCFSHDEGNYNTTSSWCFTCEPYSN